MNRIFVLTRWINPWFLICCIAHEFCVYKEGKWYISGHPHWDCKSGKPFEWSVKKYGERPQDVFHKKWESRRRFWSDRLQIKPNTFTSAQIEKFRREFGVDDEKGGDA